MNIATSYLGLKLRSPFVVGASPFCDDLHLARKLEDFGAGALVMRSLFEEQLEPIRQELANTLPVLDAFSEFPDVAEYQLSPESYLRQLAALHQHDFQASGFEWAPLSKELSTVIAFLRKAGDACVLVVCNMTPQPHYDVAVGLPSAGAWTEVLNSDAGVYGGSRVGNFGCVQALSEPLGGQPANATITIPPLATVMFSNRPLQSSTTSRDDHHG